MRLLPWLIPAALCVLWPDEAAARDDGVKFGKTGKGLGLGVSLGGPTGASIKYFPRPRHAFQFHVAYGLLHHGDGYVSVDYTWHTPEMGDSPIVDAMFYFGLGVGLGFWAKPGPDNLQPHTHGHRESGGGAAFMLKAPIVGLTFHWANAPVDTALEVSWSPYVVLPELAHVDGSMKIRYYF